MEENEFGYLYVLDFSYPGVYEIELVEEDQKLTSDKILEKHGLKESNCNYMYSDIKLELSTLEE